MHIDFDADQGHLKFKRSTGDSAHDDWRRRLYDQAKPRQISLLKAYGAEVGPAGPEGCEGIAAPQPRCVCSFKLRRISVRERVLAFIREESPVDPPPAFIDSLMQRPPIVCDLCDRQVLPSSNVWNCENGRRTVLHAVAYDVCESCFALHAFGVEIDEAAGVEDEAAEDEDF